MREKQAWTTQIIPWQYIGGMLIYCISFSFPSEKLLCPGYKAVQRLGKLFLFQIQFLTSSTSLVLILSCALVGPSLSIFDLSVQHDHIQRNLELEAENPASTTLS